MNAFLQLIAGWLPEKGDYRVLHSSRQNETSKTTVIEIRDSKTSTLIAAIEITRPR